MSFSLECHTKTKEIAVKLVDVANLPQSVKDFAMQALSGVHSDEAVFVKIHGHLFGGVGDYRTSSVHVEITPIEWKEPLVK